MLLSLVHLCLPIQLYSVSPLPLPHTYESIHLSLTVHPLHCSLLLLYLKLPLVVSKLSSLPAIVCFHRQASVPTTRCSLKLSCLLAPSAAPQHLCGPPSPLLPGFPVVPGFPQPPPLAWSAPASASSLLLPCLSLAGKQEEKERWS